MNNEKLENYVEMSSAATRNKREMFLSINPKHEHKPFVVPLLVFLFRFLAKASSLFLLGGKDSADNCDAIKYYIQSCHHPRIKQEKFNFMLNSPRLENLNDKFATFVGTQKLLLSCHLKVIKERAF